MPLTGYDEYEAETFFPMLGMAIRVVQPGEPSGTYHWETEAEDFLVLHGEGVLIVEGQERPLKQWDFVHCPPETKHAFVGAGDGPCVLLCASSRQFQKDGPWGFSCFDETAAKYNAPRPKTRRTTRSPTRASRLSSRRRYRDGLLPALAVPRHIVLLRGINIGPRNRIAMPALREALEEAGFTDVQTYLQSGNVVLESRAKPETVRA